MIIRKETPKDYDEIHTFIQKAFETAKVKDGTEQDFVRTVRESENYMPKLSLVLEEDKQIVGHIMLSRSFVENDICKIPVLLLAPLAVEESRRNKNLGAILITTALQYASFTDYKSVFLLGDKNYYSRFGFEPASKFSVGINMALPKDMEDNFMAKELKFAGLADTRGTLII